MDKVYINNTKHITIANIYIPPRDSTIQNRWHGHTTWHTAHHKHTTFSLHRRCERILHSLALVHRWSQRTTNSRCHQQLRPHNTNTPTKFRTPHYNKHLHHDTTTVSNTQYNRTSWTTQHALSLAHLANISTISMTTDYNKIDELLQTTRKPTGHNFTQTTIHTNIHTANRIFTNIIMMAYKHNIPKGKMHSNCRLLHEDILCKITQRNNMKRANGSRS